MFKQWSNGTTTDFFTFLPSDNPIELEAIYEEVSLDNGTGLLGRYFRGKDGLYNTKPRFSRVDKTVDFEWANGSPDTELAPDFFSVQWLGEVIPLETGEYTFYVISDDGIRLFVNHQVLIDQWIPQATTETSSSIFLEAGKRYPIRLDYFEEGGYSVVKLLWSSMNFPKLIIPKQQLFPINITEQTPQITLAANPVGKRLEVEITTTQLDQTTLTIYDVTGKLIQQVPLSLFVGINRTAMDLNQLADGIYFLKLKGDTIDETVQFAVF
ncbi:MAG: T9SS type A sorting domain-containing protein [Saprospiraceae bacterium]|nr:T9SS type A sorting domain-containing protein [Saprospiraceae bacterium]